MSDFYHRIQNINRRKNKAFSDAYGDGTWLSYIREAITPLRNELTQKIISQASCLEELLIAELQAKHITVEFIQIGGTSLNTHISGKGKVDMLMIYKGSNYNNKNTTTRLEDLIVLKDYTLKILQKAFPEVLLDDSQPLALEMSIQSWLCSFCLYFGFWHEFDSRALASGIFPNTIFILNKDTFKFERTNPILALHQLSTKDHRCNGNVKVLIRILKNLKTDSKESIPLTGYQLTSIVYSMDETALSKPEGQILFLLLECNLFVKKLCEDPFVRRSLKSPENNPLINRHNDKSFLAGCIKLKNELDKIIKHLVLEIDLYDRIPNETITNTSVDKKSLSSKFS